MSVFGVIKADEKVFTGDKIRFDFKQSFLTPDETLAAAPNYQASFDGGATFIDVSTAKQIDFIYSTPGTKTVQLKITAVSGPVTFTETVTVLDIATQGLFSNDSDLYRFEPEIDSYLPKKWSSWNIIHLQAQEWIMDWLDESRIYKQDGAKYTVADVLDIRQVKQLSTYKALEFIFEGNSNVVGDLFSVKRDKYKSLAMQKLDRNSIGLDYNGDSTLDPAERRDLFSGSLIKR